MNDNSPFLHTVKEYGSVRVSITSLFKLGRKH